MATCLGCGDPLPATGRSDRRFHDATCRMRAHRRRRGLRSVSRGELDALVAGVDPALAEVALVAGISAAASDDWTAAAWLLERQHPGRWGLPPLREQLELGSGEPL